MVRYVVFTQEELDAIKDGFDVILNDNNGNSVIYTNEEKYTKMLMSLKEKEIDDQ